MQKLSKLLLALSVLGLMGLSTACSSTEKQESADDLAINAPIAEEAISSEETIEPMAMEEDTSLGAVTSGYAY